MVLICGDCAFVLRPSWIFRETAAPECGYSHLSDTVGNAENRLELGVSGETGGDFVYP